VEDQLAAIELDRAQVPDDLVVDRMARAEAPKRSGLGRLARIDEGPDLRRITLDREP
jgi:hypothetical protein